MKLYLKMTRIPGTATQDGLQDYIEVLSFNWGVVRTVDLAHQQIGPPALIPLSVVRVTDAASPALFLASAKGDPVPAEIATLDESPGSKPVVVMRIQHAVIAQYQVNAAEGAGAATEAFTIGMAGKIAVTVDGVTQAFDFG